VRIRHTLLEPRRKSERRNLHEVKLCLGRSGLQRHAPGVLTFICRPFSSALSCHSYREITKLGIQHRQFLLNSSVILCSKIKHNFWRDAFLVASYNASTTSFCFMNISLHKDKIKSRLLCMLRYLVAIQVSIEPHSQPFECTFSILLSRASWYSRLWTSLSVLSSRSLFNDGGSSSVYIASNIWMINFFVIPFYLQSLQFAINQFSKLKKPIQWHVEECSEALLCNE
jgi:hypothetical protein